MKSQIDEIRPVKSWFFLADAHLSRGEDERRQKLIRFLRENRDRMECLVMLGDLFDFWFGFPGHMDPAFRPFCEELQSLSQRNVDLIYLEGNHEFSMGPFFTQTLKCKVFPKNHTLQLDGRRIYLSHGDEMDPSDLSYRIYRTLVKNRIMYALVRRLGPRGAGRLSELVSQRKFMHRRTTHQAGPSPDEQFARSQCIRGADVVILAHTHEPKEKTFVLGGRTCYYFNVGDWMDHFSYLEYHPERGFQLRYYEQHASAPGTEIRSARNEFPEPQAEQHPAGKRS